MTKFISLIKIQFKDLFNRYQSGMRSKNDAIGKLLMLAVVGLLLIPSINFSLFTFKSFAMMNHPELVITSMYVSAAILMFVLAVPFLVSVFFYSKDMQFLASLPIREDAVIFSKLSTVYLYLMGVSGLLIGPAMVIYGIHVGFSLTFIITGILTFLLSPILPLLISALLVLLTTRLIINSSRRNLLTVVGNLILLIAIIGIQVGLTRYMADPAYLQRMFSNKEGLLGIIGLRFPPAIWMTKMILGSFVNMVYFIGVNLVVILLLQSLAGFLYRRAMLAFNQGNQALTGKIYYVQRNKGWQLTKRHVLIILTQPTFLLNTVLNLLLPILMYIVMAFTGEMSLEILKSPQVLPYMLLVFTGIVSSPAIISSISSTAITREGKTFWETKVLPISAKDNLRYRVYTTLLFNFAGSLVLLIISLLILPVTFKMVVLGSLLTVTLTLFLSTADIIVNIYRPLLNWTNPTAAVKNNMNIMFSLGIRAIFALIFYLIFKYIPGINWDYETIILLISILFFVLYLATRYVLYNHYVERFSRISN